MYCMLLLDAKNNVASVHMGLHNIRARGDTTTQDRQQRQRQIYPSKETYIKPVRLL